MGGLPLAEFEPQARREPLGPVKAEHWEMIRDTEARIQLTLPLRLSLIPSVLPKFLLVLLFFSLAAHAACLNSTPSQSDQVSTLVSMIRFQSIRCAQFAACSTTVRALGRMCREANERR